MKNGRLFVLIAILLCIPLIGSVFWTSGCTTTTKTNADGTTTKTTEITDQGINIIGETAAGAGSLAYILVPEARLPLAGICALTGQADASTTQATLKQLIGEVWQKASDANQWAVAVMLNTLVSQAGLDKVLAAGSSDQAVKVLSAVISGICSGVGSATGSQSACIDRRPPKTITAVLVRIDPVPPWASSLRAYARV